MCGEQVLYFHTDRQGTVEVLSTDTGTSHRREYDVWGAPEFSASEELTRAGYTGHQHDADLGLIDMRGRIYDPLARRFLTPDPVMQAPFWSQGLNRYSYVFNDPVNRVDPSGFASFNDIMSKAVGTFVALGYGASAVATAGGFFGWSAAGAGGTAAWGGGGIYGTVTDPHFGGAYAGASGTASLSSSSTTSQALQQRLSEAPDQRTACYPACLPDPNAAFPDTEAGRAARDAYYESYFVAGVSLLGQGALSIGVRAGRIWWLARSMSLVPKSGAKLAQQMGRWRAIGGVGGREEFLRHARYLAAEASVDGQVVMGTVGRGAQALTNATIYRRGSEFLVVQANRIMSYVSQAAEGGIVGEYLRLGGRL